LAGEGILRERGLRSPSVGYSLKNGAFKRGETPLLFPPPLKQEIFRAQLISLFEMGIKGVSIDINQLAVMPAFYIQYVGR
jgi:hypothetical protein